MFIYWGACHSACVEVREQLAGISSLLLLHNSLRLNSGTILPALQYSLQRSNHELCFFEGEYSFFPRVFLLIILKFHTMHPNSTCFPFLPALLSYTYTLPIFPYPPKNHKAISGSMDHRYSHGLQWQHQPRTTGVFQGDSVQKTNHSLSQISCYAESG